MIQSSLLLVLILLLVGTVTLFAGLRQRVAVRQESVEAQIAWYRREMQAGRISSQQFAAIRRELLR
ncbi:hypothetical protein [Lacticaseibacillus sp. GG6-2]